MPIPSDIVTPLKDTLTKAQEVLVLLPQNAGQEMITGALGLYQVLTEAGKNCLIACPSKISDAARALPGGTQIAGKIGNRNLVISLKVSDRDSIDKVSYNLDEDSKTFNLIIQPKKGNPPLKRDDVNYSYSGATADLIITVGANRLEDLGTFYEDEHKLFSDAKTVSLHRFPTPTFADYQILDANVSGFGELAYELAQELGLTVTADAATNFLAGIDIATNNLQNGNLKPDSLEHMAQLLRAGGVRRQTQNPLAAAMRQSSGFPTPLNRPAPLMQTPAPIAIPAEAPDDTPTPTAAAPAAKVPDEWLAPKIYKSTQKSN